jgi:carbon-monoxide dehydrogenase medium subunit
LKDFDYVAASSVEEAVGLLAARGDRARILAGGTDILVQLREGLQEADLVVDVKKIPDLLEVRWTADGGLSIGAAVPCIRLYRDRRIASAFPAVADSARIIGGWQIQSRASLGGNLCNSSPAADSIPALIACQAQCLIAGPQGTRTTPVESFCTAPGKNVLSRGEFLLAVEFPPARPRSSSRYVRFIPRNEMDIAVAGCGAFVELNERLDTVVSARIALAAVAPTPLFAREASEWLAGKPAAEESFAAAGQQAKNVVRPIDDMRGTIPFRLQLVAVLTRRALAGAADRIRQQKT